MTMNTNKAGSMLRRLFEAVSPSSRAWHPADLERLEGLSTEDVQREAEFKAPVDPHRVEEVLDRYQVKGSFKDYRIGPSVTTYEVEIPVGTRISSVERYREDIARDLGVPSLRVVKATSGSMTIGLEIENGVRLPVDFKALAAGIPRSMALPVILGEDTYGRGVYRDLADMPHLLVAGQTGSGKSVFMTSVLATLCGLLGPDKLRLMLVDPKRVEFADFEGDCHLQGLGSNGGVAYEVNEARELLHDAMEEMDHRFEILKDARCKNIRDYNRAADKPLPYIVVAVDEFADLMLMGSKQERSAVEQCIVRIAQKARAVGIHLVLGTQKPLVTVVTSLIKGNMPARVAFSVTTSGDSRVILDEGGAEALTGKGDMLYRDPTARLESERLRRVQAPWVSPSDLAVLLGRGDRG
jgi:S-DNA-T family DNA segregation ATPase FtsK/SpoIIIE